MLIVTAVLSALVGLWLLGRRGLEGSEPMSVQGMYGWFAYALSTAIFMAPAALGTVFGVKAYRAGARGLGLTGALVNGILLVAYTTLGTINLATQ